MNVKITPEKQVAFCAALAASGVQVQDVTDEMKAARASDEMKGPGHV